MSQVQYKIYAKIKSQQNGLKNIDIIDPKTIQIKRNNDISLVHLNWILSSSDTQQKMYQIAGKKPVEKLVQGFSSMFFCYGAQSSGKTYSLIGREEFLYSSLGSIETNIQDPNKKYNFNEKGIILRTIQYIFYKSKSYQHLKHFIISCSCIQIRKDKIIDLGKKYLKLQGQNKQVKMHNNSNNSNNNIQEFLNIQQDKNGNFQLNNLTITTIKNINNFTVFLKQVLKGRQEQNSHFILQINLLQSDKQKTDTENIQSSITFIQLGYLKQQSRQDQALTLQTQLNCLSQILKKIKNVDSLNQIFRQTKLTKILKSTFQKASNISLIGTLQLNVDNIQETLGTISYINRCKAVNQPKQIQQNYQSSLSQLRNKYNKQLKKYDILVQQNKQKIQMIQQYIGVQINLNDIHKNTIKQISALNNFKQALQKVKYLNQQKLQNQKQIQQLQLKLSKQIKLQQQRQRIFLQKKIKLQKQKQKQKIKLNHLRQKQKQIFKQHIYNFQKNIQSINYSNIKNNNKQYQNFSKMSHNINNYTQINLHIQQTQNVAAHQAKQKFLKKINIINQQRQQKIHLLYTQFQKNKRNIQKKIQLQKSIIQKYKNQQISNQIIKLSQLIFKQQKIIKQIQKQQQHKSNSSILKKYKINKINLPQNFNQLFKQSLKQSNKNKNNKFWYQQTIKKFYQEQLFQIRLKKKNKQL